MIVQFNNNYIYMIIHFYNKLSINTEHRRIGWRETEPGYSGFHGESDGSRFIQDHSGKHFQMCPVHCER